MKNWKIIFKISLFFIIFVLALVICEFLHCFFSTNVYPCEMLGVTVYNWFDEFGIRFGFMMLILGIPFVIDIIILLVSRKKMKKKHH